MIELPVTYRTYQLVEEYFSRRYRFRVTRKDESPLMRFLAKRVLSRGGIIDADAFMKNFTTTMPLPLKQTVCFISWDNRRSMSGQSAIRRIETLAHETHHVAQMGHKKRERRRWATGYVMDPGFRVEQEIEAYAVSQVIAAHTKILLDGRAAIQLPCGMAGNPGPDGGRRFYDAQLPVFQDRARSSAAAAHAALHEYALRDQDLDRALEELNDLTADPIAGWAAPVAYELLVLLKREWERDTGIPTEIYA